MASPVDSLLLLLTGTMTCVFFSRFWRFFMFCYHLAERYCYYLFARNVQRYMAAELLGVRPCVFKPHHSSKLGNEFRLFVSYDPGTRLGGLEEEVDS